MSICRCLRYRCAAVVAPLLLTPCCNKTVFITTQFPSHLFAPSIGCQSSRESSSNSVFWSTWPSMDGLRPISRTSSHRLPLCLAERRSALPAVTTSSFSHPISNLAIAPSPSLGHAHGTACQSNLKLLQTLRCLNANLKHIYLQLHITNVKLQVCDIDIVLGHRSAVGGNTDSVLLLLLLLLLSHFR